MNALFSQLLSALIAGGPDSPDVAKLISDIQQKFPDQVARVQALCDSWRISLGQTPRSVAPPGSPGASTDSGTSGIMKYVPWILAVLGIGGAASNSPTIQNLHLDELTLPVITNPWVLLGIVAGIGAIAGLVNSIIRNRGLVFPAFARDHEKNMLAVNNYGFLGDLFTGAVAAAVITWTAFPTEVRMGPGEAPLLQWNVLVSAAVAGWCGARVWCGWRNQNLLITALAETSKLAPETAQTAEKIRNAPTVAQSVMIAIRKGLPGLPAPATSPAS